MNENLNLIGLKAYPMRPNYSSEIDMSCEERISFMINEYNKLCKHYNNLIDIHNGNIEDVNYKGIISSIEYQSTYIYSGQNFNKYLVTFEGSNRTYVIKRAEKLNDFEIGDILLYEIYDDNLTIKKYNIIK